MVATALVLAFVLVAAVTDLRRHKIYNWTTYPGMLAAVALNAAASLLAVEPSAKNRLNQVMGWVGLRESLLGLAVCGGLMLLAYVFFRIGGGDVKLLAMLGGFLGMERGIEALLWTFVIGGAVAIIVLIWRVGALQLARRVGRGVLATFGRISPREAIERERPVSLYLAPSAAVAVIVVKLIPVGAV